MKNPCSPLLGNQMKENLSLQVLGLQHLFTVFIFRNVLSLSRVWCSISPHEDLHTSSVGWKVSLESVIIVSQDLHTLSASWKVSLESVIIVYQDLVTEIYMMLHHALWVTLLVNT